MDNRNILFKEMKFRYRPTDEDWKIARDFCERTINDHIRGKRSLFELRENIILGKLGEIAYKKYWEDDVNDVDLSGIPQGKEPDFLKKEEGTRDIKVQIKTIEGTSKWVTFSNWNFDLLVVFQMKNGILHYIDTYTNPVLKEKARESNYSKGWYFDPTTSITKFGNYPEPPVGYNYYP
jgi:hypothetical protein